MDKRTYLLKNIYKVHRLAVRIFTDAGEPVWLPCEGFERRDPVCCSRSLREALYEGGEGEEGRYVVYDDGGYYYCVFRKGDENVVWGPFVLEVHSEYQDRMYLGRCRVGEKTISIPFLEMDYARSLIAFLHGLLFGEYGSSVLFAGEWSGENAGELFQADLSRYIAETAEQEREHSSYQREREFFAYLLEGRTEAGVFENFGAQDNFPDMRKRQGIVAESQKKQVEYNAVTFITLLTRHVMNAGVSEAAAYRLSDVCLQELSRAERIPDMEHILQNSVQQFVRLVREHHEAEEKGRSPYIGQCKDYIARHIFEKLTLTEIAQEAGVHPAYLSRLFARETGMGISNYILQEKIRISCNLLTYSGRSIATVAEYVGLSPQSYYTKVFKKVMNQTPAQYRKEHRNHKFL